MKTASVAVMESVMSTSPRVPYFRLANEAIKGLLATSKAVHDSSIDPTLM